MTVLLIEDDVKIADSLRRGLGLQGFRVEWSADGLDGLWRVTEGYSMSSSSTCSCLDSTAIGFANSCEQRRTRLGSSRQIGN